MLTPPSPSSSPSLSPSDTVNTRKRQRSQSMQSEPSSSSPKRAVSEDPSQDNARSAQSHGLSSLSIDDANADVDAYMAEQGEDASANTSVSLSSMATPTPEEKLSSVESSIQSPMRVGETWYVVSSTWFRRWRKAVSKEVDKDGEVDEKDLGPVDNGDIVVAGGDVINQQLGPEDYIFVPEQVWTWLTAWYGKARYELPRKVITRGVQAETSLELHPPKLKLHVLTNNAAPEGTIPPRVVTVSANDTIEQLYEVVSSSLSGAGSRQRRIWKLSESDTPWEQLSCSPDQLKQRGGVVLEPTRHTIDEKLVLTGDALVVEFQEDSDWVVNVSDIPQQPTSTPVSESQSTVAQSAPKRFSENGFLDLIQKNSPTVSNVTSSPAEPVLSNTSNRAGPSSVVTRSRGSTLEPGTLGLGNMGNTCFMNSALQCLVHTKELAEYFLTGVYEEELNPDNPLGMGGAIAQAFGALLHRIWSTGPGSTSFSPREFKQALQRFAPQFSGYQQHDSQELVAFLLDGLHEDLNRVLKKPYVEKPDWEGGGDKELVELANESWQGYMRRNDSVIVDLFQGQYQSTLVCPECSKVSITFDPFMYLTLPLPIQKKWRHDVYYIPWDLSKPHVKVPVEIGRDASFKELRQLLGKWMTAEPDHLLTLEVFNHRFYKDLDDTVLVGDMAENDIIVCFELPCHAQQSRTYKPNPEDPFIIPVMLCDTNNTTRSYGRNQNLCGYPFIVVITHEQATDPNAIYDAIADRLQRWTENVRDLFTWEAGSPTMEPVHIPIAGPAQADSVTELIPDGDTVHVQTAPEEGDITDEKDTVVRGEDAIDIEVVGEPRKVGFKRNIFKVYVQAGSAGIAAHYTSNHRFETFEQRMEVAKRAAVEDADTAPELLQEGDAFLCEFDHNVRDYYFGDDRRTYDHARWASWPEFVHPEYKASREAAAAKRTRGISLQDCLDEFTKEEKLGEDDLWYCPRCKKHQQATKRFDLWKVPDILVVHLKRFSNSRTLRDKIDVLVDFPTESLDISSMVGERQVAQRLKEAGADVEQLGLGDAEEPLVYDLYAVDEHMGGLGGGHYRAFTYNHVTDKWYHFDDSYVSQSSAEASVNPNAYLLFYRRRTNRPIGGKSYEMIEAAKQKAAAPSLEEDAPAQLPTPPSEEQAEFRPTQALTTEWLGSILPSDAMLGEGSWLTPQSNARSSPASSPPPLDDVDLPTFEESQDESLLQETLDPLVLATHQFDFPNPSSSNSPTSSNEAEPDLDSEGS